MQKQIFHTADPTEFEKCFFEEQLLDFPKYLAFLATYLESKDEPIKFIQAAVHTESEDGEKEDVLTVETVFLEQPNLLRIWGVRDLQNGVTLKVTVELIDPETQQTKAEYTVIENGEELFQAAMPE